MQEQDVGGIEHRDVCSPVVRFPSWSSIKVVQCLRPSRHVREAAEPDKSIRIVEVAEGANDMSTYFILSFDEFALKHCDQFVSSTAVKRVLAQLHDGPAASGLLIGGARWLDDSETRCSDCCEACRQYCSARRANFVWRNRVHRASPI